MKHPARHIHIWKKYKAQMLGALALVLLIGAGFGAHYIYTGKGWLLVSGKETVGDFYFQRGLYYFGGGGYNLDTSIQSFNKALFLSDEKYPFAHYQLARIYFIKGDFSTALRETDAELEIYPDHFRTHYVRGLIYGYRKQYIQAEEEFKLFIAQEPFPTWAGRNDLTWIYFSAGDYVSAARTAKDALEISPDIPWLQNSYAVAELNLGEYKTAETYLLRAQRGFAAMTEEQWGVAYPGNHSGQYAAGLAQTRAAIEKNLEIVHNKLKEQ